MRITKIEAQEIANRCFGRHQNSNTSPEKYVSSLLAGGDFLLADLAKLFITTYLLKHPELLLLNLDNDT